MEHVAERAMTGCNWLIAAVAAYIVLAIVPLTQWSSVVGLYVGIPGACTELVWLVPALIGVRILQDALHEDGRFRSVRWTILALAFWCCGVLGFYSMGVGDGHVAMVFWIGRLCLLAVACWWLVNLLAAVRRVLDQAWPGELSVQISAWVLGISLVGQAAVLALAAYRIGLGRSFIGDPMMNVAIAIQIASWYVWPIVVLVLLVINRRALVRMDRGRCLGCGFELHGSFDAGCPECGWRRDDANAASA